MGTYECIIERVEERVFVTRATLIDDPEHEGFEMQAAFFILAIPPWDRHRIVVGAKFWVFEKLRCYFLFPGMSQDEIRRSTQRTISIMHASAGFCSINDSLWYDTEAELGWVCLTGVPKEKWEEYSGLPDDLKSRYK